MKLMQNWRIWLLIFFILISVVILGFRGIDFGIDFKGGTLFTIEFSEKVTDSEQKARIAQTVSQRLDWTGLRDTTVTFFGDEFVLAQLAETDSDTVARIESLLQKQGRFEATIDGNLLFTGEALKITRDPTHGYGFRQEGDFVRWYLPFTLNEKAATRFRDLTFHKCALISFDAGTGKQYECEKTFFFIDRPTEAVIVIPGALFISDRELLLAGAPEHGIFGDLRIEELLANGSAPHITIDSDGFTPEQLEELQVLSQAKKTAIVPSTIGAEIVSELESLGFEIRYVEEIDGKPWIWDALGVRSVINLSEDVAHMDVPTREEAEILTNLQITGLANDFESAQERLSNLDILLSSGSLPVSVKSISKESISPLLGENFLSTVIWMAILAIIVVAIVVFLRYRVVSITAPLVFMIFCETLITVALASMISKFDLGAVAGIIAAVGTGIDTEIIITDELLRGEVSEQVSSLVTRVKRAFFIVFAAASVSLATMLPIVFIGFGMGKLVGFAITTSMGVLVGVLITRPAFGELARLAVEKHEQKTEAKQEAKK
ncbi:MAG: hypothetical protein JW772_00815 [Candidatus Diapherotrites archaeon]|nr:hypothetical protein [Candidatus Diapherotrites archaeon]